MIPLTWKHVEAHADADFVVAPDERLGWTRTIGIGAQHVVAMFGATFLVPHCLVYNGMRLLGGSRELIPQHGT